MGRSRARGLHAVLPANNVLTVTFSAVSILVISGSSRVLVVGQFVLHGLPAGGIDQLYSLLESVEVTLQERRFELALDVATCTAAAVVRQTDLLRDTDVEYQGHGDPSFCWMIKVNDARGYFARRPGEPQDGDSRSRRRSTCAPGSNLELLFHRLLAQSV
jgi:hypothetical protein